MRNGHGHSWLCMENRPGPTRLTFGNRLGVACVSHAVRGAAEPACGRVSGAAAAAAKGLRRSAGRFVIARPRRDLRQPYRRVKA